ncbi:xylulokinase [Vagococcus fluvialis]|uniref:xylulokinase n=1 Tax=Vagococcus fluvialis TaxID=2738 RepID=UPI003D11BA57
MSQSMVKEKLDIINGQTALGIELGSTRIKAVLIDSKMKPIASGSYEWENSLVNDVWTYSLDEVWQGLQASYRNMAIDAFEKYGETIKKIGSIGFSAMMHGYLVFDKEDQLLVPFRTWRNAMTEEAEEKLTEAFQYNIPQRWSIAHLYQAILNKEPHVENIDFMTTLAGYVHWQLTEKKVLGVGDASGMFPIDPKTRNYDFKKIVTFEELVKNEGTTLDLLAILPKSLVAGENAGVLTENGAKLLDTSGNLKAGCLLCPPEGDAGTGMVATNSITKRTGNISAGTSAFAMIVLEEEMKEVHREIDLVITPVGDLVAMVHTNNCSSEINGWMRLFQEFTEVLNLDVSTNKLYEILFNKALEGEPNCGGLLSYGYYSGENITRVSEGRPLFVRTPESEFTLANFMRMHISSAFGAMRIGMDILKKEGIKIDQLVGHGGIFKTPEVAQRILASAMEVPVTVMETAGEGGAWGIAVLASYLQKKETLSLEEFLNEKVFAKSKGTTIAPTDSELKGYETFVRRYEQGLPIEQAAIEHLK